MSEETTGPSRAAMVFTGLGAVVALVLASVLAGGSNATQNSAVYGRTTPRFGPGQWANNWISGPRSKHGTGRWGHHCRYRRLVLTAGAP